METEKQEEPVAEDRGLFREEAFAHYADDSSSGDVLRASPHWAIWTYRLLGLTVSAALLFLVLGETPVYETGPAVLQIDDVTVLSTTTAGIIDSINALPGHTSAAIIRQVPLPKTHGRKMPT